MGDIIRRPIIMRFPGGKSKAVTLSYDDGVKADKRLIQIMNQHGLKGTFNISGDLFSPEGTDDSDLTLRMTYSEAKQLFAESGQEVAIHGLHHGFFRYMSDGVANFEICEDRRILEEMTDGIVRGMAYPFGFYNDSLLEILKINQIAYARTTKSHFGFYLPDEFLTWHPTCHHNYDKLEELTDQFLEEKTRYGKRDAMIFYLWGHSYEFVKDDNWDVIERFAEKMGNRDEIWYATNMEIYQYIKGYEQLEYDVTQSRVHNPTGFDLWIEYPEWNEAEVPAVCIPSGKTVNLKELVNDNR